MIRTLRTFVVGKVKLNSYSGKSKKAMRKQKKGKKSQNRVGKKTS